jgi:hypothetical protein
MAGSADARRFGARTQRIKIVDYYTVPWEDVPAATPPAVMILVRDWFTEQETAFAWHLAAEREGIPAESILSVQQELERHILRAFYEYVAANPKARWVHWGLSGIRYGFPALSQRAASLDVASLDMLGHRAVDLAQYFRWHLGEDYVPHKRLTSLARMNQVNTYGRLGTADLTAACREGRFVEMLASLRRKVACVSRILDAVSQWRPRDRRYATNDGPLAAQGRATDPMVSMSAGSRGTGSRACGRGRGPARVGQ